MKSVIELFEEISAIPRCSYESDRLKNYLVDYSKKFGFEAKVDKAGNVLCKKGEPKVCLQSHYDMVCLGDAPKVELVYDESILRAKNSTLGADNGMGVAIMLYCMQKYNNLETLFTANEEVGLIGASNLELEITAPNILNIDSEDENAICIGCAGGSDVICEKKINFIPLQNDEKIYKASVVGLPGGHSGVDIDKNIPSSIKVLARFLSEHNCELIDIKAGERRNSIAKNGEAIFTCRDNLKETKHIKISQIEDNSYKKIKNSKLIIKALDAFCQGVRAWNKELNIPQDSANLGVVEADGDIFKIVISLRSMSDDDMGNLEAQTRSFFEICGFETSFPSSHEAWTPYIGDFAKEVKAIASKYIPNIKFEAIHAGLECGILIAKQDKPKEAVSIGPNIRFPHSLREECDLDSVEKIKKIVEEIILL